ncbi:hypothetical protein BJV77DRAFT_707334 [Russula vinacea]|nr:hypothetical protein BJV77DRAFT_707334 [Russula vinacea]
MICLAVSWMQHRTNRAVRLWVTTSLLETCSSFFLLDMRPQRIHYASHLPCWLSILTNKSFASTHQRCFVQPKWKACGFQRRQFV